VLLLCHLQVPHRGDPLPHHRDHQLLQHRAAHLHLVAPTQDLILVWRQEVAHPLQDLLWEALVGHHHKAIQAIPVLILAMAAPQDLILELPHM